MNFKIRKKPPSYQKKPKRPTQVKRKSQRHRPLSPKGKKNRQSKISINAKKKRLKYLVGIKDFILSLFLSIIFTVILSTFFVSVVNMQGYSMIPTLRDGDKLLLQKNSTIRRFDLVAFTIGDGTSQIRRIIGLPGETIYYTKDTLFVDGQPVDEKFLIEVINESQKMGRNYTEDFGSQPIVLPKGYYFVLGDNRSYAMDSRHYGLISAERLIGKVALQLFPVNEIKAF